MKLKFFSVDALEPDDDQSEVDDFCTRHRLISIDKRFVERGDLHADSDAWRRQNLRLYPPPAM
ncbi:MAG: hypothetical protein KJ914_14405 [Gammaproteobacteria bacterium]|nr:hypothetical protein [Gammaproteobacteria bacterium]MBU1724990.1 hypothetical protein [Gammaproteobacteria bacterium]MBU2007100.1 hypothetical protein [Gammaproteobacteria bacterium]